VNRRPCTHGLPAQLLWPVGSRSALGAGTPTQVRPLSVVRTIEVHGLTVHGAVPSSQPLRVLTNAGSLATNPFGTGPPGGPAMFVSADVEADVEAAVDVGGGIVVDEPLADGGVERRA
jgi:hypothetical protein